MLAETLLLIATFAQHPASATTTQQRLAERFVEAATPEKGPAMAPAPTFMAEKLVRANPGREHEARRVADLAYKCVSLDHDGKFALRQAAIEAAIRFSDEQLKHLISFIEMRKARPREGASNRIPAGWEAARRDYGRWMYSIAAQPSALALMKKCSAERAARIAAAGLHD
jgi:hypothetical protein